MEDVDLNALKQIDKDIANLVASDDLLRKAMRGKHSKFFMVEDLWTMEQDPFRIRWEAEGKICGAWILGDPIEGEKLVMFTCSTNANEVFNIVAEKENYFTTNGGPEEDETVIN